MRKIAKGLSAILLLCIAAILVFAACTVGAAKFTISFEMNGGTAIESVEVGKGEQYTLPVPEREGYSFEGWFDNAELEGSAVTSVKVEKNATFYAKWEQMYAVTFSLGGGTLSASKVYLKAGARVLNAVQDYIPSRSGHEFDCWLLDEEPLSANYTMPKKDIVLTARYKVGYTIEVYLEKLTGEGYEQAESVVEYGYAKTEHTPDYAPTGFVAVDHENAVKTLTLSENPAENVFRLYFDRQEFVIFLESNYPDGKQNGSYSIKGVYGQELELPNDLYSMTGYCLEGWSSAPNGEVEYFADYIHANLFRGATSNPDTMKVTGDKMLYAVWTQGYRDMFGGSDYLYLVDNTIYLSRAGYFFAGEYNEKRKTFTFGENPDIPLIEGRLNDNGTYLYYHKDLDGIPHYLYNASGEVDMDTWILFDGLDGITFSDGTVTVDSTFRLSEEGYYIATFPKGPYAGQELTIAIGNIPDEEGHEYPVFLIRNEEEYGWGKLVRFVISGSEIHYYDPALSIKMDGFGTAVFFTGSEEMTYYYVFEDGRYTLLTATGANAGIISVVQIEGKWGYLFYDEDFDAIYTAEGGATLSLDGLGNAEYINGKTTARGYYSTENSLFGGHIVRFTAEDGTKYAFIVTTTYKDGEGDERIPVHTFAIKGGNYAEYLHKNEVTIFRAPLIVFDEAGDGKITLYGYTKYATYAKVSVGSYLYNDKTGFYTYTVETHFTPDVIDNPYDLLTLHSVVFALSTATLETPSGSNTYDVTYFYSMTKTDSSTENYIAEYELEDGKLTLLYGGFAIYETNGTSYTGVFVEQGDVILLTAGRTNYYFELNRTAKTAKRLTDFIGTTYELLTDGYISNTHRFVFDGKGGAVYTVGTGDSAVSYVGTYRKLDTLSAMNDTVYEFTAEGLTFRFLLIEDEEDTYFARYNEDVNGSFRSADGSLLLDGFGYKAEFTDANGNFYSGLYFLESDGVVAAVLNGRLFYFDLTGGNTFTLRGSEYGIYLYFNNTNFNNIYFEFDGYGKLSVFTIEGNAESGERVELSEEGATYEKIERGFLLHYVIGNREYTIQGNVGTIYLWGAMQYAFFREYEEVVSTFINEKDWTVLTLDGYGNATRINELGERVPGNYIVITTDLLFYSDYDDSNGCLYRYNLETYTLTPISLPAIGYYTENLEALVFTSSGFVLYDSESRYYYNVAESGEVVIYKHDPDNLQANRYGFVEDSFGAFDDEKSWGGRTYYMTNGYAVTFKRAENGNGKYPVALANGDETRYPLEELIFAPTSSGYFTVSGRVRINGTLYDCYVTRARTEDGTTEMYISIMNYRFYIDVDYRGDSLDASASGNSYKITAMRQVIVAPASTYLYYYYQLLVLVGPQIANLYVNNIGTLTLIDEYNEAGDVAESYFIGSFGSASGIFDSRGNIFSFEKSDYTERETEGTFTIDMKSEADGYDYHLYFAILYFEELRSYTYLLQAFTREEVLTVGDYTVTVERLVWSDITDTAVSPYWSVKLSKDGTELKSSTIMNREGTLYYVVRTTNESGTVTATKYYVIEFTPMTDDDFDEDEFIFIAPFKSVSVEERTPETIYNNAGTSYIDLFTDTHEILLINYEGEELMVADCTYSEPTDTYTVYTTEGRRFTVKFGLLDGELILTEVFE